MTSGESASSLDESQHDPLLAAFLVETL